MLTKITASSGYGNDASPIEIECDITSGLPAVSIVGLGDKAVGEAKERVRSAIRNSGLHFPPKRITMNLAPADIPKDGTSYDLAMAVAVLAASGQIAPPIDTAFVGELALDGTLRSTRGILASAQTALDSGLKNIIVPDSSRHIAGLVSEGIRVLPADNLQQVWQHLSGQKPLPPADRLPILPRRADAPDLADIYGQERAKRALEIAAAGNHNLLFSGPPGTGKTMMAKTLAGLLPLPTSSEITELAKIADISGSKFEPVRPFRSPHHTASHIALIGGGSKPKPGEVSLAHRGILFLDEFTHFSSATLEALRQPLEDGKVTISRSARQITLPAQFMLVAAMNPCPCGYVGHSSRSCVCSPSALTRYQHRLSGPIMDRIDLSLEVPTIDYSKLVKHTSTESSSEVSKRISSARQQQTERLGDDLSTNGRMTNAEVRRYCQLAPGASRLAELAAGKLALSGRGYVRMLKVARTIADLNGTRNIDEAALSEALSYRLRT